MILARHRHRVSNHRLDFLLLEQPFLLICLVNIYQYRLFLNSRFPKTILSSTLWCFHCTFSLLIICWVSLFTGSWVWFFLHSKGHLTWSIIGLFLDYRSNRGCQRAPSTFGTMLLFPFVIALIFRRETMHAVLFLFSDTHSDCSCVRWKMPSHIAIWFRMGHWKMWNIGQHRIVVEIVTLLKLW